MTILEPARGAASSGHCLRLRIEEDGAARFVYLTEHDVTVGAAADNTVVIGDDTVSRRHAVLHPRNPEVDIHDVGSKNGTFVNGVRIRDAIAVVGDRIRFGAVRVTLERADRFDAELGIELGGYADDRADSGCASGDGARMTREMASEHPGTAHLETVEVISGILLESSAGSVAEAVMVLGERLAAGGVAFLRWDDGPAPVRLVSWGTGVDTGQAAIDTAVGRARASGFREVVGRTGSSSQAQAHWAISTAPGRMPSALVVTGDSVPAEGLSRLLRIVLRMLLRAHPEMADARTGVSSAAPPDLVFPEGFVIGRSPAIMEVYRQLRELVRGDIPVLVLGETGVGKEHIARILHRSSHRREGPFVAVNCAAIPAELLESELLGIEGGVATGVTARPGKFLLADGGVLLLDEIGDMSLPLQGKLLRTLQDHEVHAVGARVPHKVDIRVVASTNANIRRRVDAGQFRSDLFYRLAGFTLRVPPLRERQSDIPLLVEHFVRRFAAETGKNITGVSVRALQVLSDAPWPGNVRQLEHEIRRLVYVCRNGSSIDSDLLSAEITYGAAQSQPVRFDETPELELDRATAKLERRLISLALAQAKGNRTRAAKLLGVSRNGLAMKMERLGLSD